MKRCKKPHNRWQSLDSWNAVWRGIKTIEVIDVYKLHLETRNHPEQKSNGIHRWWLTVRPLQFLNSQCRDRCACEPWGKSCRSTRARKWGTGSPSACGACWPCGRGGRADSRSPSSRSDRGRGAAGARACCSHAEAERPSKWTSGRISRTHRNHGPSST